MLSLGRCPELTLKQARTRRDDARKLISAGDDSSSERKIVKADKVARAEAQALADAGKPGPGTFEHAAREWLTTVHEATVSLQHADRTCTRFEHARRLLVDRQRRSADVRQPAG